MSQLYILVKFAYISSSKTRYLYYFIYIAFQNEALRVNECMQAKQELKKVRRE